MERFVCPTHDVSCVVILCNFWFLFSARIIGSKFGNLRSRLCPRLLSVESENHKELNLVKTPKFQDFMKIRSLYIEFEEGADGQTF